MAQPAGPIRRNVSNSSLHSGNAPSNFSLGSQSPNETSPTPSPAPVERRKRRGLLKQFYGDSKPEEPARVDPLDMDGPDFDADLYLKKILGEKPLAELVDTDTHLVNDIRTLDSDMQTLVYENYNKFISATETIRQMKSKVETTESEMLRLDSSMQCIMTAASGVNSTLDANRSQLAQLAGVHNLLKKLQFLFELPARLKKCIELQAYRQAVSYYTRATGILRRYQHLPSFQGIHTDCQHSITTLTNLMWARFDTKGVSAVQLGEAVDILLCLKAPSEELADRFISSTDRTVEAQLVAVEDKVAEAIAVGSGGQTLADFLTGLSNTIIASLKQLVEDFKRLFSGDRRSSLRRITAVDSESVEADATVKRKFSEYLGGIMERLGGLVTERFNVEVGGGNDVGYVGGVERLQKMLQEIDGVYGEARFGKTIPTLARRLLAARTESIYEGLVKAFDNHVDTLKRTLSEKPPARKPLGEVYPSTHGLLVEVMRPALKKAAVCVSTEILGTDKAKAQFVRQNILEGIVYRFIRHVPTHSLAVCQNEKDRGPSGMPVVFARLCLDMESSLIGLLIQLVTETFPVAKGLTSMEDTQQLMVLAKNTAQQLANNYVAVEGLNLSSMVRKSVETRDWLTTPEPRMVRAVMRRVVEDLLSLEADVAALFDDDVPQTRSSDSSRRTYMATPRTSGRFAMGMGEGGLMANIQKLFTDRIVIFGNVDFSKGSVMTGIVKICLKAMFECVRLRTFGRFGYQQLQVDVAFLRSHLPRFVPDDQLLNFLLEEVMHSAQNRCLDPVKMDTAIVSSICEK